MMNMLYRFIFNIITHIIALIIVEFLNSML